jgi:polyferredoxin
LARKRTITQFFATIISNANLKGFVEGKIYQGQAKNLCVPGLNCYSCPGAIGSCPIGSLQAVVNNPRYKVSYYVIGLLALFGVLLGRFICGWLCPFGWFQDLFNKIPSKKLEWTEKLRNLRFVKYFILAIFVIIIPTFIVSTPTFCKYICPAGTLEASLPLLATNPPLRALIGLNFYWKLFLLVALIGLSIIIYRPFCYSVCPLGAIYSVFNKVSFYQLRVDKEKCISCQKCLKACKFNIYAAYDTQSFECIRCGDCVLICPTDALSMGLKKMKKDM